ncbi:MAG: hypothetical protein AB7V22_07915 [Kiritimatiellia bacterium]|jgi:hypothetical protein|nr:hypothetical protein [Kiritimatiellia bacterium]MDD4116931.1 hypothetical protein [Kiritimatiellia bacterium]NCD22974.1 hypothetical protein [Spartobacteria bacterium]
MKKYLLIAALLVSATLAFAEGKPQTTCPVMKGNPVSSQSQYVDVEGYRIYVCCGGCIGAIKADPAKYIAQMQADGVELETAPVE